MNKLSLAKLGLGFGALLLLLAFTGSFHYFATARLAKKAEALNDAAKKKEFSTDAELSVRKELANVSLAIGVIVAIFVARSVATWRSIPVTSSAKRG